MVLATGFLAGCGTQTQTDTLTQKTTAPESSSFDAGKTYLASGHPEWSPIMWQEGDKIVGAGPQLLAKIAGDLGFKIESNYAGSWDEVQQKARSGEVDMLVAAYKTTERETYMDYSDAYTTDPIAIFVKKGNIITYKDWNSLIGKKGVATVGDSYGQEFDDFIKAKLAVQRVDTADQAFATLKSGKADYFLYSLYAGERVLKAAKTIDQFEILPKYAAEENFYFTISKQSPLVQLLPQINEEIAKYKANGTINQLIKENKAKSLGN